jgi:hypothetical protein
MKNQLVILGIIAVTLYAVWMFCGDKKIIFWRTWRYLVEWGFFTGIFVIGIIHFDTIWQLLGFSIGIAFGLIMTIFHIIMINKTPTQFFEYLNCKNNLAKVTGLGIIIYMLVTWIIGNKEKIINFFKNFWR